MSDQPNDGQGGGWTAPEGVPDAYRGASADETLGRLLPAFTELNTRAEGLRTKLATLPKAPDSADAYSFEPDDKLKPFFSDFDKTPAFGFARTAAHAAGITQEQFSKFISGVYGPMAEAGQLPMPFNPKAELDTYMGEMKLDRQGAVAALEGNLAFAKGLSAQLKGIPDKLKPGVEAALLSLTDTAEGNALISALSSRLAESGFRIAGEGAGQGMLTEGDLKRLDADPRIDPSNRDHPDAARRFDPDLRKRYDDAYARLYPRRA